MSEELRTESIGAAAGTPAESSAEVPVESPVPEARPVVPAQKIKARSNFAHKLLTMRLPLRVQITTLLTIFLGLAAAAFYSSTRNFLERDKIGTVRELQTFQVADLSREISDRFQKSRQELREGGVRLLDSGRGIVQLDPEIWSWVRVRDKVWKSPKFEGEVPDQKSLMPNVVQNKFRAWPEASGHYLILEEPLKVSEGGKETILYIHGQVQKRSMLGDPSRFNRGPVHGLLFEAADLDKKSPRTNQEAIARIWVGTPESGRLFSDLLLNDLTDSAKAALSSPSQPSSRELRDPQTGEKTFFSWATVPLVGSDHVLVATAFVDQNSILRGFRRALAEQAFWGILILGMGILGAGFLARRMSAPIEDMLQATHALERGDFKVRVLTARKDELGDLAAAFNHMGLALEEREDALKSAQGALVQSEKLAALGTLSAGIAHEVKNPLAGILGHADMASNQIQASTLANKESVLKHLETIQKETKRCRGIIDNLMRFSRKDKAEKDPFEMVDLEVVAWEAIHLMEHSLNLAKIKIDKNFCQDAWMIAGNSNQVEQVILNMLQNAGHAMPNGGTLTVATEFHQELSPGGKFLAFESGNFKAPFMRITIRDSGIGMSEEVQKKIFEPFFTTKPKGVGTGLGLSVTMGILGDHSARVSITSAPGEGTCFFIDFMAKQDRSPDILAQLEEVQHRKGGGAKVATDIGSATKVMPAPLPEASAGEFTEDNDKGKTVVTNISTEENRAIPKPQTNQAQKASASGVRASGVAAKFTVRRPNSRKPSE